MLRYCFQHTIYLHICKRHQTKKEKKKIFAFFLNSLVTEFAFHNKMNRFHWVVLRKKKSPNWLKQLKSLSKIKVYQQQFIPCRVFTDIKSEEQSQTCHISLMAHKSRLSSTAEKSTFLLSSFSSKFSIYVKKNYKKTKENWHNTTGQGIFFSPNNTQ